MENKIFLEQMKLYYDSLKYFDIQDNFLILQLNKTFRIPLRCVNLSTLDKNIFMLSPVEIFQIIYVSELLYKENLGESEKDFIINYTKKYLELSDNVKTNQNNDLNKLWCLEIPINVAYKDEFFELPGSKIIISEIDRHLEEINSGLGKSPKLVLKKGDNPNFELEESIDQVRNFEKAGFTTLFLITSAVAATCMYIAYFIFGH